MLKILMISDQFLMIIEAFTSGNKALYSDFKKKNGYNGNQVFVTRVKISFPKSLSPAFGHLLPGRLHHIKQMQV